MAGDGSCPVPRGPARLGNLRPVPIWLSPAVCDRVLDVTPATSPGLRGRQGVVVIDQHAFPALPAPKSKNVPAKNLRESDDA